jgi:hypothetical protein
MTGCKRRRRAGVFLVAGLLGAVFARAEMRTWTSVSGDRIEAEFVALDWDTVHLRNPEGTVLKIRINRLSSEDQILARTLQKEGSSPAPKAPPAAKEGQWALLPVFPDGPHKGQTMVYEAEAFTASMNQYGDLIVQPRENGKAVGKAFALFQPRVVYTKRPSWGTRKVIRYDQAPVPAVNPTLLEFEGETEEGVKFTFTYTFEGNSICAEGTVKDPGGLDPESFLQISTRFPKTHDIAPAVPQAERVKILAGHELHYAVRDAKPEVRPFHKGGTFAVHRVEWAEVRGAWGSRTLRFEAKKGKRVDTSLWSYGGEALWNGFHLFHRTWDGAPARTVCATLE